VFKAAVSRAEDRWRSSLTVLSYIHGVQLENLVPEIKCQVCFAAFALILSFFSNEGMQCQPMWDLLLVCVLWCSLKFDWKPGHSSCSCTKSFAILVFNWLINTGLRERASTVVQFVTDLPLCWQRKIIKLQYMLQTIQVGIMRMQKATWNLLRHHNP